MKCQVCQADLSPGSTFCTNCGTPVPSNPYGSAPSSPNQGIAPTVLASSPQPDPYAPSPAPSPYSSGPNYGAPSTDYGASAPPPANPYGAPPSNPYGTPPPPAYNPTPGVYGAPGTYGQAPYIPQPPQKKGPNGCVIAAIIVGVLVVLIGGGLIAAAAFAVKTVNNGTSNFTATMTSINATSTADMGTANALLTPATGNTGSTPSTGNSGGVPSASQVDANAQSNITGAQTASSVDTNTAKPTHVTSNFTSSDTIYITYTLAGNAGYTIEKTYDSTGTEVVHTETPYKIASGDTNGYFQLTGASTGAYTTGIYWCKQSSCSDAALAQVVTFSVA